MEEKIKIMDLPKNERPREKLLRYGTESLTNSELLAVILRTGTKKENILDLCSKLIKLKGGINGLLNMSIEDITNIKGIGTAKGAQILAVVELSKRFKTYKSGNEYKISSPKEAASYVMESMRYMKQECLRVIMLNTKNVVIFQKDVSIGSLNSSIVHPREVYCEAIRKSCASIIICHNHPSGDPTPSEEDINVTNRLKECGRLLGIELIDHIIIGNGRYTSLKEKGIL